MKEIGKEWCWLFMHVMVPLLLLSSECFKMVLASQEQGKDNLLIKTFEKLSDYRAKRMKNKSCLQ